MDTPPLILTARLDDASFRFFDEQRRRHFPPSRNLIPAHLTLFHALPGDRLGSIAEDLTGAAAATEPVPFRTVGLRFLGYGSAYEIRSPGLDRLRAALATDWFEHLTRQDAQTFRAHVTVQNKVSSPAAKTLFASLEDAFEPMDGTITGLQLWHYRGGPWETAGEFAFGG